MEENANMAVGDPLCGPRRRPVSSSTRRESSRPSPADRLQPVQREILCMLAAGSSDDRVAEALGVGLRTVQRHVAILMELLGARSRFQAGVAAVRAGWLDNPAHARVTERGRHSGYRPEPGVTRYDSLRRNSQT